MNTSIDKMIAMLMIFESDDRFEVGVEVLVKVLFLGFRAKALISGTNPLF
jgi:hypothetical protein